ncbi:hypothetical protein BDN70DRAFT_981770 [Pholiota conissans]|uniref:Uncharacterized protein n=1 Tax=Pholiota conissans TaxID=109636 RepID=A0A9P5Z486_9AGAR|nr:hypothetical protein BDN70DRAFT_981770 [Pholiota conissans]
MPLDINQLTFTNTSAGKSSTTAKQTFSVRAPPAMGYVTDLRMAAGREGLAMGIQQPSCQDRRAVVNEHAIHSIGIHREDVVFRPSSSRTMNTEKKPEKMASKSLVRKTFYVRKTGFVNGSPTLLEESCIVQVAKPKKRIHSSAGIHECYKSQPISLIDSESLWTEAACSGMRPLREHPLLIHVENKVRDYGPGLVTPCQRLASCGTKMGTGMKMQGQCSANVNTKDADADADRADRSE